MIAGIYLARSPRGGPATACATGPEASLESQFLISPEHLNALSIAAYFFEDRAFERLGVLTQMLDEMLCMDITTRCSRQPLPQ